MNNKKKLTTKLAVFAASATMVASMFSPMAVMADNYDPVVSGTSTAFNKYLIVEEGSTVPNINFAFSIEAGTGIAASATSMEILAPTAANGVTGTPKFTASATDGAASFSPSDSASTTVAAGDTVTLDTGEAYAKKSVSIDFSGVTFSEPGVYRYLVTETSSGQDGIAYDTQSTENDKVRVLDVYVTDDGSGSLSALQPTNYVLHDTVGNIAPGTDMGSYGAATNLADKSDGFVNEYSSIDLVFKKEVTGNQASRDKYFAFTLTLSGLTEGDSFVVSYANDNNANTTDGNADASITANPNAATKVITANVTQPATLTASSEGTITQTFYLQHGQEIAVRGLPTTATYSVTENREDYKSTPKGVTGYAEETTGTLGEEAGADSIVKTSYMNTRDGVIPTGIVLAAGAGLAAVGLGAGGLVVMSKKNKKRREEDED